MSEKTEENEYIPDDETVMDYLIQRSNEAEHEVIIIGGIIKRLRKLREFELEKLGVPNQDLTR